MANDCCGVLKVVSKNKDVFERIKKIFNYEDDEYCLYRVRNFEEYGKMYEDGEWFVQDFFIDGAWSCEPLLNYGNNPEEKLVIGYEKDENGREDYTKKVYGTAHFTDLSHLAKVLGFGCEFWTEEPEMMFAEYGLVNSDGHYEYDTADYEISYPKKEDGHYDYDHPIEKCGFGELYAKLKTWHLPNSLTSRAWSVYDRPYLEGYVSKGVTSRCSGGRGYFLYRNFPQRLKLSKNLILFTFLYQFICQAKDLASFLLIPM